jgi:hypothetical protein
LAKVSLEKIDKSFTKNGTKSANSKLPDYGNKEKEFSNPF